MKEIRSLIWAIVFFGLFLIFVAFAQLQVQMIEELEHAIQTDNVVFYIHYHKMFAASFSILATGSLIASFWNMFNIFKKVNKKENK